METLGSRIKARRIILGLTQEELAQTLGITRQAWGAWEAGTTVPSLRRLEAIAAALHQTVGRLFGGGK